MTTVGFGSGSFFSNNPRRTRGVKRKHQLVRRSLLESLEARHLMAAGPQLIGVQPNEGSVIALGSTGANATVLNVSPREIVLRFDDTAALDPNTLTGIQVKRSGSDGILESAYLSTDLGTNGQVVLDFSASLPGQQGNGLELRFTQVARSSSIPGKPASWPILSVVGSRVNIEVNIQAGSKTTAADLIRAMTEDTAVAQKVLVKRLRGLESTPIADTVPVDRVLTLQGADAARVSSNLNTGNNTLQVEFISSRPGQTAQVEILSQDFGGQQSPTVTVDGQTVRVVINSNSRFLTTVQELMDSINNTPEARQVVQARLVSGSPTARVGANFPTLTQLSLAAGDDVTITPAFIGFGDSDREVVIRFAEALPDDFYLIDILGTGPFALRNAAGLPFNMGINQSVRFDLDLGTTVQAVVPQPVVRAANGSLTQLRNQIYVYFNDDDLNPVEAVKTEYYQLVHTRNTIGGQDDIVIRPSSVSYDANLNRATLTFNRNLDALVDPSNGAALPLSALRLRIGNSESPTASPVTEFNSGVDAGSRFDSATDLGGGWLAGTGAKSAIINSEILNTSAYTLDFPGANDELGNRDNRYQHHVTRIDEDGIKVYSYNFAAALGNSNRSVQLNAITETQKNMVRQVMSLYERYLGVRFTESDNLGFTIAVGDMQAINPTTSLTTVESNRPGGLTYAAGPLLSNASQSAVIVDIQDFNTADDNQFGTELFRSFMRGIGVLLGLGNADELPQATVQNNAPITDPNVEQIFPGVADIIHGQFVLRPESKDIDLYRFAIPARGGRLQLQIAAERQSDSSLLDASLKLYRNEGSSTSPRWVEIAANEDYYSEDPRISLDFVRGGDYIVGVSAKGNTGYDPNIEDSGIGGRSEGKYQLRLDYRPPAASTLVDVNGFPTALDGDGDGRPGGVFNYWFVPTRPDRALPVPGTPDLSAYTVWVDKTATGTGNGTLASPYNTISRALQDADAAVRADTTGNRTVTVRIVGNTQNRAYEIGFNRFGNALADGSTLDVPKNVTVMIDAGAIIKMGRARISAGSSTVSVDRSGGSLQLLGIPDSKVVVTSINDTFGIGVNPDRTPPAAAAGDWGGIDFRNRIDGGDETRIDKERNGLFLNSIIHSDIRFGGGQVIVDGVSQVITPINLFDSRPTIINNLITRSADAAMSATPNSFREDDFADPRSQSNGYFVPDYDRVGPDIHGNRIINNTINGLFVRTRTGVADTLETITVAARFDDVDIPHVIGETLVVAGQAGGGITDIAAPPTTIVDLIVSTGGTLAAGTYNYRLVYVDAAGNESLASIPTISRTVAANSSIQLVNLPPVSSNLPYVARRLYRSDATGGGTYRLVTQLNAIATTFTDNGTITGSPLVPLATKIRSRLDGGLVIDAGAILKFRGSRIEVRDGGTLIAEGSDGLPIVMTSLNDNTYGFGGTFDTGNTRGTRSPNVGDWGGIFVGQGSSASMDFGRVSYAGGTTRVEGGFAAFNAIEVHQADFRMSNSRIENNDDGVETSTSPSRVGRGTNSAAAIFVRGSQPVLLNNRINDNAAAAISIDVNSLGPDLVNDPGRQSGLVGKGNDFIENQGPLIDGNRLSRNELNGMVIRGQTLTTQSVWDDTDIVHIVPNDIVADNFHSYGGLRLKSASGESLVVKFGGTTGLAGLTATGTPLDYSSRLGGSIQLVGQPSYPVILTSLADDTVGAGFGIDGRSAFDTDNDGTDSRSGTTRLPTGPEVDRGVLIDNDVDPNRPGFFSFIPTAGGNANFRAGAGITAQGTSQLYVNNDVIFDFTNYIDIGANGNAFELANTTITQQPTLVTPDLVVSEGTFAGNGGAVVRWRIESRFDNGISKLFNTLTLNSDQPLGDLQFINYLDEDIQSPSDDFLYVTGTPGQDDFRAFTIDNFERFGFSHGGIYQQGVDLQNATYSGWAADRFRNLANTIETAGTGYSLPGNINTANLPPIVDPVLGQVYGLADVTTALAWRVDPNTTNARITSFLELVPTAIQRAASPGSWDGVSLQTYSNDRNVGVTSERESPRASAPSINDTPNTSQYLGQVARLATSGDENARLGFEIQGVLNKPSDVDVYSFTANGRTEVWLDIDRTTSNLDTVVELVAADGTILALSDSSYLEETQPSTNPLYSILSGSSVNPLRKASLIQAPKSSRGEYRDDYGMNPKDAGLRVLLPGRENEATLYHVRVRSSNQFPGQPASTPALSAAGSVGQGRSKGSYQLQIRLDELQEIPGSAFNFADIRFASNGLTLSGVPRHSPLVGETAEVDTATNDVFAGAQELGNILQTDRRTIAAAGNLSSPTDIDWFTFTIDYQSLLTPLAEYLSTIFDVDYADGIGRADMSMYLYDSTGRLIQFGEDSNVLDDRATAARGADNTDLGRGSAGTLDPYIGSVELPAGRYFLALTNRNQVPSVLANRLNRTGALDDSGIRVQPINSGRYIVEDRVGSDRLSANAQGPITPSFLPQSSRVEYTLGDVPLYLSRDAGLSSTEIFIANSFTGEASNFVGRNNEDLRDIAIRPNGDIRGFRSLESGIGDANASYINVNAGSAAATVDGNFGTTTSFLTGPTLDLTVQNVGIDVEAITFMDIFGGENGFLVANRAPGLGVTYTQNILYRFNANTGLGTSQAGVNNQFNIITNGNPNPPDIILGAGTSITERGFIQTAAVPGAVSTSVAVTEATEVRSGTTRTLIRDGDTITIRVLPNTNVTLEFNAGPEILLALDPTALPPRTLNDGDQFILDGVTYEIETAPVSNVPPNVRPVFYRTSMTNEQFVDALRQAVPPTIQLGFDGSRVNFRGATTGSFGTLVARGVATDLGSNGNVGSGRIAVDFFAEDTADTIATRLAQVITTAGFAGLSALPNGNIVNMVGAEVISTTGSSRVVGLAPGGSITGIAGVNGTLYAVSDAGGLYTVSSGRLFGNFPGNVGTYVNSSYQLGGLQFTGLTAGPQNVANGQYANLLFGTTANGRIYAFNTLGELQNVFANGQSSVSTGIFGLNGLAFSNLDYNLWQQTQRRNTDAGHGINTPSDLSDTAVIGGTSWYFGFDGSFRTNASYTTATYPLTFPRSGGEPLNNTYNFPGGALGVLESQPFSLSGMTVQDIPTLYFNYFMSNDDGSSGPNSLMTDSFRVYGIGDDGIARLLTTNNRDINESGVEKTTNNVVNPTVSTPPAVAWRQARVDLSSLAGSRDVRLRFEFNTAGSMGFGAPGGRGFEMRVVAGKDLVDGQIFAVDGRQFEIEMGFNLVVPSGAGLQTGDQVTVLDSVFVMWDGTGAPPIGNFVQFDRADSPEQVAQKLIVAFQNASYAKTAQTANLADPAGGSDILTRALSIGVSGEAVSVTGTGEIGDNPNLATGVDRDIDLFRLNLEAGTTITITASSTSASIPGGSLLDPYMRLFDAAGRELTANNDFGGSRDSRISFTVQEAGRYFVGVSGSANTRYNPNVANSGTNGGSQGKYELTVDVTPRLNFALVGNRINIDGADVVSLPANSPFVLTGSSGLLDPNRIPVYIRSNMTEQQVAREVARAMENGLVGGQDPFTTFSQRDRYIDVTGVQVTNPGPFTVSTPRLEDNFSEYGVPGLPNANRSQNNAFEGLYLDDFIIGLAERGESVTGARADTTFVTRASSGSAIIVGPYQLEIRGGAEYGRPLISSGIQLTSSFGPNQQQSRAQTIRFNGASQISDGQTIVISDGSNSLTLEFEDVSLLSNSPARGVRPGSLPIPFNSATNESSKVIASRVRDLINSVDVQSVLRIAAISLDGSLTGQNSDEISLVGSVSATLPPSVGTLSALVIEADRNTPREQGQVIVENTRISNSLGFGITLQADPRTPGSNAPNPGSVRNTITLNNQRLVPGAVIVNNELIANLGGGINIVGETTLGNLPAAPVPFARILNNTILGGNIADVNVPPAATIGDDFYGLGLISFADNVVRYEPTAGGGPVPLPGLQIPGNAIGAPNYSGIGEPVPNQGVVSLGRGGVMVVQFTNNILTGSNDARADLAVYEVGLSEQVRVEVSPDNTNYTPVGSASFNNRYIDLDAFGFNSLSQLYYVRLTDVSNDGALTGDSVGADIDAVGAISSRPGQIYTPRGVGINVGGNASPTLLNNIVANHVTGIAVDSTSASTVIGATLYQGNTTSVSGSATLGQFPITITPGIPLFTNAAEGNLYPVPGSAAIDSTIDSLVDRSALLAVKQPLGLAASPIIAPSTDINGMLRVDDPAVLTPPGLGEGIFKDRGAADRADFVGPTAVSLNPIDNDTLGSDSNPALGTIELVNSSLTFFDIQILDASQIGNQPQGTGINQRTVTPAAVLLYRNGEILVEGLDYRFGYDSTSNIVRLTPLTGVWETEAVYQIRFINTNESQIELVDPRNVVDGTIYTILDSLNNNTRFELNTGLRLRVPASSDGFTTTAVDGAIFRIDDGFQRVTFEFDSDNIVRPGNVRVAFSSQDQPQALVNRIITAILTTPLAANMSVKSIGNGEIQILGNLTTVIPEDSGIVVRGRSGTTPTYGLQIPTANGLPAGVLDGQTFTIQRGNTISVFEIDTNGVVLANSIRVPFSSSVDGLAISIVNAINGANLGLTATSSPGGIISVGTQADLRIQATNTVLQVVGAPGRPATIPVHIDLTEILSSSQLAERLVSIIAAQNLPGVQLTQLASRILIEGALGVAGVGASQVSGIRDRAGNPMRATEINGQTLINIFLGEGLDYGDAADPIYASKKSSNGPRHTVVGGFSLGPTVTSDPDARLTDLDLDDGVTLLPMTAAFTGSIVVNVQGASPSRVAFVNAWIDFDGDGIFEGNEKLPERSYFNDGSRQIDFSVSNTAKTNGPVAVRVRMSSQSGLGPVGVAPDGEVEDYSVSVLRNPYTNPTNNLDVSGDGNISPIDVLQLVNYINFNGAGPLPFPVTVAVPPYLDVNGDGSVGPLDVLSVINFINARSSGGGTGGEGEGVESNTWIPASRLAAPAVDATKQTSPSVGSSKSEELLAIDQYITEVSGAVGTSLAVDELDWSTMCHENSDDDEDSTSDALLGIDDLVSDLTWLT
ncbi:MAG: pre-peptidase C-terminal domain-containing protein [Pirellula sp.]